MRRLDKRNMVYTETKRCFRKYMQLLPGLILVGSLLTKSAKAQISPPGLSDTRLAAWMAIGVDQSFGKDKSWQSISYVGYGFMSHPAPGYRFFEKPSMYILNEEVKKKLSDHFSITGALSYRGQYLYNKTSPYHKAIQDLKKEFRMYSKLTYGWKTGKTKWNMDFRPEFRKFFLSGFQSDDPRNALRARFKLKSTIPMSPGENHFLILSAESLFQNERTKPDNNAKWTGFFYDDSRFCVYYRYVPQGLPFFAEIGYMNNLAGKDPTYSMHHIGLDIVFKDIF